MSIKLLVSDLDGTLLQSDGKMSEATISCLMQFQLNGGCVLLATSRHWNDCIDIAKKILLPDSGFIATSNGMYIYNFQGEMVKHFKGLTDCDFIYLKNVFPEHRVIAVTNGVDYVYSLHKSFFEYLKCCISNILSKSQKRILLTKNRTVPNNSVVEKIIVGCQLNLNEKNSLIEKYNVVYEGNSHFELQSKYTDKLFALRYIMEHLCICEYDTIAFGDSYNDMRMLTGIRNGIAMGNAVKKIKQCARDITLSNNEDGVVYYLKKCLEMENNANGF